MRETACSLKLIDGNHYREDVMIEAPPHYVEGRTIEPIQIVEDVRFRRLYEIV